MSVLTESRYWKQLLKECANVIPMVSLKQFFSKNPQRFEHFSLNGPGVFLDYSKNLITEKILILLCELAEERGLADAIHDLFSGQVVNPTEKRAALHTALRHLNNDNSVGVSDEILHEIHKNLDQMRSIVDAVIDGTWCGYTQRSIRDIVNIGIGGSDIGPAMAYEALKPYVCSGLRAHFVSNLDEKHFKETILKLDPATTLFVIVSKSFRTEETLANAELAKQWLENAAGHFDACKHQFIAVTSQSTRAKEFGVMEENILQMSEWVGGRFSLWSAAGISLAMVIGMDHFYALLEGAHQMDEHFRTQPFHLNMPVILGLLGIWYSNFLNARTHAIIPYDQYLRHLIPYLQQLHMESQGKRVTIHGEVVDYQTGTVIWGGVGTNSQHTFHQLLMQGTQTIPIDFILPVVNHEVAPANNLHLIANCLSQAQILMHGNSYEEVVRELKATGLPKEEVEKLAAHQVIPGNCPSNMILLESLTPTTLGSLLALYEHKIFIQSIIWDINPFDQWGVERGKHRAQAIYYDLARETVSSSYDASTRGLMQRIQLLLRKR